MIAAMGQMLVLAARHVDLSIGSIMAVSAMASGMMFRYAPEIPWVLGFPLSIGVGDPPRPRQRRARDLLPPARRSS
jgi:rhamnose transport system permease protein